MIIPVSGQKCMIRWRQDSQEPHEVVMENKWNVIEKCIINYLAGLQLRINDKKIIGLNDFIYYESVISDINELRSLSLTESDSCKCDALTTILENIILIDLKTLIGFDDIADTPARYIACKWIEEAYTGLTQQNASISKLINNSVSLLEEAVKLRFRNIGKEA